MEGSFPFIKLMDELKFMVICKLDVKSLCFFSLVCKEFNSLIDDNIWKHLCIKDFEDYVDMCPLSDDFAPEIQELDPQMKINRGTTKNVTNWRNFYKECFTTPNLNGDWVGNYGPHGDEYIRIVHKGYYISATKITGDVNVPAGKITWHATLCNNRNKGWGQIQVANVGYVNPRWGIASMDIKDEDNLIVTWHIYVFQSDGKEIKDAMSVHRMKVTKMT